MRSTSKGSNVLPPTRIYSEMVKYCSTGGSCVSVHAPFIFFNWETCYTFLFNILMGHLYYSALSSWNNFEHFYRSFPQISRLFLFCVFTFKAGSQYTQHVASHHAASAPQRVMLFGSQLATRLCATRLVATKCALPPRNYWLRHCILLQFKRTFG